MAKHVHFIGICGYAVSGAALIAKNQGYDVTGSDEFAYPPVSDIITDAGIRWENHHSAENLTKWGRPDVVVVGNQTRPHNPEWAAAREMGLEITSEIELFVSLTQDNVRVAVCGTHGKTTTSSLLAHMLETCGMDPGFRLGSTSLDFGSSARLGRGPFVYEGDEYTTAPWDGRAKFLHIHPRAACVTRLELDHPDIYASLEAYREPFVTMVRDLPRDGLLVLCGDDPEAVNLKEFAPCPVLVYGTRAGCDWRVHAVTSDGFRQHFRIQAELDIPEVALTFPGVHNALNATAALALANFVHAPIEKCVAACGTFRGPARRFEILGDFDGVTVVDDYAHHPTEVHAAVNAARQRYEGRRIVAIHTPHTYSRTRTLLADYGAAFEEADIVMLGPIEAARERHLPATITSNEVAGVISGKEVHVVADSDQAIHELKAMRRPGDVFLVLSLGGFDKLALRLKAALQE